MTVKVFLRSVLPRAVAVVFVATVTTAWATVTSIVITPVTPDPPILGQEYTLAPNDSLDIDTSEWWLSRLFDCAIPGAVVSNSQSPTAAAQIPGTCNCIFTNKCNAPGPGEPVPQKTAKPKTIIVAPANDFLDTYGLGVRVFNPGAIHVELQVLTGDKPCGTYMAGEVQQKLTNIVVNGEQLQAKDWHPNSPGTTLTLLGSEITDEVGSMANADTFNSLPLETVFYSATQEFRILYSTPCSPDSIAMPLGWWTVMKRKKSATEWQDE